MALLRCPNTVRIAVAGTQAGLSWANVFHASYSGAAPVSAANLTAFAQDVHTAYADAFVTDLFNDASQITQTDVLDIDPDGLYGGFYADPIAGTRSPGLPDPVACSLVSWVATEAYKGGHGRTYIPGLLEGDFDGQGVLTGGYVADLQDAADDFLADVNASAAGGRSWELGMVHFYRDKALLDPARFDPFSGGVAGTKIATQRRRLHR